ncbi:MAG: type II toxin-antitoxin system RelE/ParE family toxin [Nitrospira sp.]|jgi:toxin ParE1/3/4|nr:type II toxin-antitoxin system RelE/ParE family toxin [Nitrospira sp.]
MRLEFHPEAELELIAAAVYYDKQVLGLGERFESEIRYATDLLLDQPEIGTFIGPYIRKFILTRFPFTLYYSAVSDVLRIEAVAHQSRRPGYWKSRVDR